jgi:hypothetical protein
VRTNGCRTALSTPTSSVRLGTAITEPSSPPRHGHASVGHHGHVHGRPPLALAGCAVVAGIPAGNRRSFGEATHATTLCEKYRADVDAAGTASLVDHLDL